MNEPIDHSSFDTDVAVIGMAGRFAGARNLAEYWNNLRDGVESLTRFSEEELLAAGVDPAELADPNYVPVGAVMPGMEQFDAKFFGFSPREASIMDPQHRHFLECAWEAFEDAGHVPEKFEGSIGVFGGSGHNAYMPYNLLSNPKLMQQVGFFLVRHTGNDKDFLTTRVSYLLNLKGPSINVQTACSTSLVAIHLGVQSLLSRECDMALAGGVTIELPHRHGYVYRESEILSPDGHCHAFDAGSKGTVFGSGVGTVLLRRLADAIADGDHIHAIIKGSAINNDGALKVGYMAPSVDGQAQAIAEALAVSNVEPDTITYVEAHGTGTPVGDPIEVAALTQAFRQGTDKVGYCGIGSVKSNIGHTDTAAGVASFMKVALALQHRQLPPTLHFTAPNPACSFETSPFYVNHRLQAWTPPQGVPRRAGVSSLGVGGTNAHVVLQEAPPREASSLVRRPQIIVQSAKTLGALDAGSAVLASHLREHASDLSLADAAHTLQVGRQAMKHRRVLVARDTVDAVAALATLDPARVFTDTAAEEGTRSVAFMFAGGGAQYPNMCRDLYREEPVFRAAVDECLTILSTQVKADIRPLLFPEAGQETPAARQLERPSLALPALLTVQYAQAQLWRSWGIEPAALIGHSMGEYTAAHLAGVFSLADALTLVELRGRLFETLPEGAMLSVPISEDELRPLLGPELSIAVVNGPRMTVAAGPVQAIEALQQRLTELEIDAARVRINVAAHSAMLEPILAEFGAFFRRISMKAPTLPFVSNLSGTWITAAEATEPAYWVRHLRNTVRFADGLRELLVDESRVLIEVGPGRTLSSLARQHPARKPHQPVINSTRHPDESVDDQIFMLGAFGRLWATGASLDWSRLRKPGERRLRLSLPTYRFEHHRHWVEPGRGAVALAPEERSLHKRKDLAQWFYQPVWQRSAPLLPTPREEGAAAQCSLVLADTSGFAERVIERLRAQGHDVVTLNIGAAYRREGRHQFTLQPDQGAEFDRVLGTLVSEGRVPSQVWHLWTLTGAGKPAPLDDQLKHGFYSLLALAQSIGREDLAEPLRLIVLSDHLQRVSSETGLMPAKATLLGPCKVIPREFANLRCQCIDLDVPVRGSREEALLLDSLVAESEHVTPHDVVAYRAARRWVQSYEPMPLPEAASSRQRLRERGVYLVTGGLGGVGLALAEHLAGRCKARLVLVGRNGLPPRAEWTARLAQAGEDPALARRIRQVMALEALGAEVMVATADVTEVVQMKAVLRQARERFGALHGVLHTAGVLADGVIQFKERTVAASVLAPKVKGTLALEAALAEVQGKNALDFMVLFSSISSFAGLAGQIDYAAANAFLDAYAQDRFARDGTPTVAVNWSQWQEVGMAAELAHQLGLSSDALADAAGQEIGAPLVQRCLQDAPEERVYATRFSRATHWLLEEHRVRDGEALIPGTGYLELVRSAFTQVADKAGRRVVELRNVTFLAPFAVRAGEEKDLRVHIRSHGGPAASFTVVGRVVADAHSGQPWNENVRGTVAYIDASAPPPQDVAAIVARCQAHTQEGQQAPVHLEFGPRWSNVRRIHFGQGEALAELELPSPYASDLAQFPLHPALMDMATAGAQALVPGFDEARDFFVPASYGRLRVFGPLTPKLSSHIRWHADENGGDDLALYDVTVIDERGEVVVEIADFTMIRVRDKALLSRAASAQAAPPKTPARPRATANNVLTVGLRDGILSDEGADVLERVLAWDAGPQVVVSPQDLIALLAQLSLPTQAGAQSAAGPADGEAPAGWKAPVTATEKLIAQMWGEMLGHERVSASDNFFDLGGHSLLAVQVINKLKKKTGKALPLTALLEAPTVETLAALIEPPPEPGSEAAAEAPASRDARTPAEAGPAIKTLIRIRPGGDRLPVFMVHDGNGETLLYRNLAYLLHPGHAVYGLQPEMRGESSFTHTRIVDMATAHIEQVRKVQPQGPYLLAGLCAGGVISFEMARQLQQAGQRTLFVGIMDAADVAAEERKLRVANNRLQRFLATLDGGSGGNTLSRVGRALPKMLEKTKNLALYEVQSRLEKFQNARKVKAMREQASAPEGGDAPSLALSFLKMYEVAHKEHRPDGRFSGGDVVVYRGTEGDGTVADEPYVNIYADRQLGWGPRVDGDVLVVDVPGGHASLLQEPHVRQLAEKMQRHVDIALAKAGLLADAVAVAADDRKPAPLPAPRDPAPLDS